MSNPIDLLPRTAIASFVFQAPGNTQPHLRVYTQDVQGRIRESRWDGGWSGGSPQDAIITDAKPNTPLAVTGWNNGQQIRVYYLTTQNIIHERCFSQGNPNWFDGALNSSKVQAGPVSALAAINWKNGGYINVYYQKADNFVQEVRHTDKWFLDKTLNRALVGSNLAALQFRDGAGIRVYFQRPDASLAENCHDDGGSGWYIGAFRGQGPASTALSAIAWSNDPQLRVYVISQEGVLQEYAYSGGWSGPQNLTKAVPASANSAITWGSITDIRVYRQANDNQILEEVWHGGWSNGAIVPTGGLQGN